jgi:hypothetical protein
VRINLADTYFFDDRFVRPPHRAKKVGIITVSIHRIWIENERPLELLFRTREIPIVKELHSPQQFVSFCPRIIELQRLQRFALGSWESKALERFRNTHPISISELRKHQ